MGRVLVALVLLARLVNAAAAEMLSPREFAERMAKGFQAAAPKAMIRVTEENEIDYRAPDGLHRILVLTTAYRRYAKDPSRLDEVVQLYVTTAFERFNEAPVDRSRIVPVIKTRQWVEDHYRKFEAQGLTAKFLLEDFNDELVIVYAEDSKERTRYLMNSEEIGDRRQLRSLALRNLVRIMPKARFADVHEGVTVIAAGGDYDPSLLLFDKFWTDRADGLIKVDGDIVVAIPDKSTVIVTGSRDGLGLKILRAIVAEGMKGPDRLTRTLLVYRDGRFQKFEP